MIRGLQAVALDCPDPLALAGFYAELLGGTVHQDEDEEGWFEVRGHQGTVLAFQYAADFRPPRWPDPERPQQIHLDFDVSDLDADEKRVLELGAKLLERTDRLREDANWRVFADPAGHPFCLCEH